MITVSGILFNLMDPDPDLININDIAHGLSNNCRWNGHTQSFFSVAEHCIRCYWMYKRETDLFQKKIGLAILLHDAEESYWGDVISPLKSIYPDIAKKMDHLRNLIYKKYGIYNNHRPVVKSIDKFMLRWEHVNAVGNDWVATFNQYRAKMKYLQIFKELYGEEV